MFVKPENQRPDLNLQHNENIAMKKLIRKGIKSTGSSKMCEQEQRHYMYQVLV